MRCILPNSERKRDRQQTGVPRLLVTHASEVWYESKSFFWPYVVPIV
jgi:hypothetical protein